MATATIRAHFRMGGRDFVIGVPICEGVIRQIAEEVCSPENRQGAQRDFGVHDPTLNQLVFQYFRTGGFQRLINSTPRTNAFMDDSRY